ncbi:MAG: sigma-70 family RNA polymerase sigma factor [Cyclobacteriaceae bacterium]
MTNGEFTILYNSHKRVLALYAATKVNFDRELAKDLTQDAFIRLLEETRRGNKITYPKAWLFKFIDNEVLYNYRKEKSHQQFVALAMEDLKTDQISDHQLELIDIVNKCISSMDSKMQYIAMQLVGHDEIDTEDAMESLDVSRSTYFRMKKEVIDILVSAARGDKKSKE